MEYDEARVLELARRAYEWGRADFEVRVEDAALLVIDMQDEFVRPGWAPFWVPEATSQVPRIQQLIAFSRAEDIPIVYTAIARTHRGLDRPATGRAMPNRYPEHHGNTEWFEVGHIWHELAPEDGDLVVRKPSYGAFYDTPLETILRNLHRETIIISGTLTNFCCGMTARQGYERGFKVVVGSDVCATDDPRMQEPELQVLRKGFARVMTSDEIMKEMRRLDSGDT